MADWSCPACTFLHSGMLAELESCTICTTPRPAAPAPEVAAQSQRHQDQACARTPIHSATSPQPGHGIPGAKRKAASVEGLTETAEAAGGSCKAKLWDELSEAQQQAGRTIGYSRQSWDAGEWWVDGPTFDELDESEHGAALQLGFSRQSWATEMLGQADTDAVADAHAPALQAGVGSRHTESGQHSHQHQHQRRPQSSAVVIDLTADDDEEIARRLQQSFDEEELQAASNRGRGRRRDAAEPQPIDFASLDAARQCRNAMRRQQQREEDGADSH